MVRAAYGARFYERRLTKRHLAQLRDAFHIIRAVKMCASPLDASIARDDYTVDRE
jgi:hypothetical protein